MTDFTNAQRETLEKMVNTAISLRVLREHPSAGEVASIPDIEKAGAIAEQAARKAIDDFKAGQKPWWKLRDRRDSQIAAGGIAALLLFGVVDRVTSDAPLLRMAVHWMAGTEKVIETEMTNALTDWANGPKLGPSVALQEGFERRIDSLAADPAFQDMMGTALFAQASDRQPEFVNLIKSILDSQPVVMFQEQARLGGAVPVSIPSSACRTMVEHWQSAVPDVLPDDFRPPADVTGANAQSFARKLGALYSFCPGQGWLNRDRRLVVPFWARLNPTGSGKPDEVRVLIQVDALTAQGAATVKYLPYDIWGGPYRIRVKYANSRDDGNGFLEADLLPEPTRSGSRFSFVKLPDYYANLRTNATQQADGDHLPSDVLHAITVNLPDMPADAKCGQFKVDCLQEISVRVIVIVNRAEG